MPDRSSELQIGTELAGFRIEALIGRGGMGVVYLAEQLRYGRKVALKVLAPELASDESFRERFEQEWRTAAKLDHPNIVPIYEAGEADGVLYIAMRYVDGTDLGTLLGKAGRFEPRRALDLVGQVAVALDAAHLQGLVHRDVKPGNILVVPGATMDEDHVYLTDFGIAKQARTRSGLTRTGFFVGTVDYASPEQIEGGEIDGRADVYALGCVLYQCLTGALPYEKDSEMAMLYAHVTEPPPVVTAKRPDLPARLDTVIAKALAKKPEERYSTCRQLVAAARVAAGLKAPAAATVVGTAAAATVADAGAPESGATVVEPGAAPTVAESPPGAPPERPAGAAGATPWWRSKVAIAGAALLVLGGAGAGIGVGLSGGSGASTEGATTTALAAGGGTATTGPEGGTGETGPAVDGGTSESTPAGTTGGLPAGVPAVAFASERDGDLEIYVMAGDGTGRVRLTDDAAADWGPDWTPDGSRIAFGSDRDGTFDVFVMNADGTGVAKVTSEDGDETNPAWSPDATRVAFTLETDGESELYAVGADGSGLVQLTAGPSDDLPTWSPDGSQVAFVRGTGTGREIWVVGADASGERQLTSNADDDNAPDWSPDGSTIVFTSSREGGGEGGEYAVWAMDADGGNPRRLAVASAASFPAWFPDGSGIAVEDARGGDYEIFVMGPDGSGRTALTNDLTADFDPSVAFVTALPALDPSVAFLTDPEVFPTEREALLLTHVPSKTRETCGRESDNDRAPGAEAGVVCTSGEVTVFYDLFPTKADLQAYYDQQVDAFGVARGSGDCESSGTAETTWSRGDVPAGRLLCFSGDKGRSIVWTYDTLKILSWAQRTDDNRAALYRFWTGSNSGPLD